MAKNLFDFANENKVHKSEVDDKDKVDEKYIRNKVNEYSTMSESELKSKLFSEVKKSKQNGTFSYKDLSTKLDSVKSYLTPEQLQKLETLLEKIR